MPYRHGLQSSRFELKYIIDENCARGIRSFVSSHLEPDAHCRADLDNAYPIAGLHFDTPDLLLCGQTRQGLKNRLKLRIRFYHDRLRVTFDRQLLGSPYQGRSTFIVLTRRGSGPGGGKAWSWE